MHIHFVVPDWALGPIQMRRDRQVIAGRALEVGFGRVFVEEVDFSLNVKSPSVAYPFFGALNNEYLSIQVVCFSLEGPQTCFLCPNQTTIMNSSKMDE